MLHQLASLQQLPFCQYGGEIAMPLLPASGFVAGKRDVKLIRDHLTISAVLRHEDGEGAERVESRAGILNHVITPRF